MEIYISILLPSHLSSPECFECLGAQRFSEDLFERWYLPASSKQLQRAAPVLNFYLFIFS